MLTVNIVHVKVPESDSSLTDSIDEEEAGSPRLFPRELVSTVSVIRQNVVEVRVGHVELNGLSPVALFSSLRGVVGLDLDHPLSFLAP